MGNGTGSLYASAKALPSVVIVGICGLVNLGLLTVISLWRTIVLLISADSDDYRSAAWRKKLALHVLLLLATLTDLPMYGSFVVIGNYNVVTYAFHKFECAFVFAAYSITITDWVFMLHEINEDSRVPFLLKRGIVWTINLLVMIIAVLNFAICLAMNNLDTYTQTPIYIVGVVTQLCASLLLTCVMLQGGIKLAWRIRGASGRERQTICQALFGVSASVRGCIAVALALPWSLGVALLARCRSARPAGELGADLVEGEGAKDPLDQSVHSGSGSNTSTIPTAGTAAFSSRNGVSATSDVRSSEFVSALRCLNLVMATCASCEFMQMSLLFLNWILGYAGSEQQTVGPVYFYWTFYAWVPLWGVVLSLLYLAASRNANSLKKRQQPASADPEMDQPSDSFSHPLLHDTSLQRGPVDSDHAPDSSASMGSGYSSPGRSSSTHSRTASDVFFRALGLGHGRPSSDFSDSAASFN